MNAPRWSRASVIASDIALALDVNQRASIGKPVQTAARDNWQQWQELAKSGERTQTADNNFFATHSSDLVGFPNR